MCKSVNSRSLMPLRCIKPRIVNGQKIKTFGSNVGDVVYIDPTTLVIDFEGSVYAEIFDKNTMERIGVIDLSRFTNHHI